MIGVLEHLQNPREILKSIKSNRKIKYLYLLLPMFSPSAFIETIFSGKTVSRQLSPTHTHLYTEKSIRHFCQEFGYSLVSEWWFGTDMVDLYRNFWVHLRANSSDDGVKAEKSWEKMFEPLIDDLQQALDRRRACSEVHVLLSS